MHGRLDMSELVVMLMLVLALVFCVVLEALGVRLLGGFGRAIERRFTRQQRISIALSFAFCCLAVALLFCWRYRFALAP